jgi:hypothetical protein
MVECEEFGMQGMKSGPADSMLLSGMNLALVCMGVNGRSVRPAVLAEEFGLPQWLCELIDHPEPNKCRENFLR